MEEFMKIRKLSKTGIMSDMEIRRRVALGKVPGFYVGEKRKDFVVNVPAFLESLREESAAAMKG